MKKHHFLFSLISLLFTAGAMNAQTVSVDKTSLSFSAQTGGSVQSQSLTINNAGSASFAAVSNANWLKVNGQSSVADTTPNTITVTADPAGLSAGSQTGALTIYGISGGSISGPPISVPVTFAVGTIGVSSASIPFAYQVNGVVPGAVALTLSSSQTTTYTAAATTTTGGSWLSVPATGSSPGTLSVSLNPAVVGPGMAPGTYNGAVTITPASGPAITVPVALTVTSAPAVTANPTSLNLNYQLGGATGSTNTPVQTLTLTNPGSQDLGYIITTTPVNTWLSVNPSNGTIPANGSVQIAVSYLTATNLAANTYNGTVTVFVPQAATTTINVPVKLLVSSSPLLTVPGATLAYSYQLNGALPASKTVLATSSAVAADATSGQMLLNVTATTASGGNWLTVPAAAQTGTAFTVAVNPAGLATGTYNGTISITGVGAANSPQTIPVTLTVSNDPLVVATFSGCSTLNTACPLNFPIQTGQAATTTQTIRVVSSTGAQASFSATVAMAPSAACGTAWLSSGPTTAIISNEASFPITVVPGTIVSGTTCTGTITITGINPSTGAALPNSPVTIPVNMYVSSSAMLVVNPVALNFALGLNASSSQNLTITSTSATDQLAFTATSPGNAPWLLAGPTARNTAAGSNAVIVAVNSSGLAPGTYTSAVTITATASGVLDSPMTVPVTLTVTAATMSATPASLSFTQTLGAAVPAAKTVSVATSSTDISFSTTVNMANGTGWLTATAASATATSANPATVTVNVNGSSLAPGTYNGTVTITSASLFTAGSPVSIPVTLEVKPGTLSATPAALTFNQVQGGSAAPAQTIAVAGAPGVLAFTVVSTTANNGRNWLSATPASGNTPGNVQVSVDAGNLPPGQYTGKVTITSAGATGSPLDIPVTMNVVTAQTVAVSPTSVSFSYVIGSSTTPQAQTVQLTSPGTGVAFTTAVTASGGANWLAVTPTSGTAPATLSIAVNTTGLAAGNYTGTVAINSTSAATNPAASITVNLTVQAIPKPVVTAISNAASYVNGPVSAGENIVIFGSGIGPATLTLGKVTNGAFDNLIANTQVFFDNIPAPIIYTRTDQTSVMVPYGVAGRATTSIRVVYQGVQSDAITYNVVNSAPGIYTLNQAGSGQGAILNQDYSVNGASAPAAKDSVVSIYMTGEGTTSPASVDGAVAPIDGTGLFKPVVPVTATVGGVTAKVEYYGSAPGILYGVMQVNVRIPVTVSGPSVPVVITVGSNTTQTGTSAVTLAVQ